MNCKHKYDWVRNESYSVSSGRYQRTYKSLDYFFCEKCLDEQIKIKQETINDGNEYDLPEWAKVIRNNQK